jgi:hypothetical protein
MKLVWISMEKRFPKKQLKITLPFHTRKIDGMSEILFLLSSMEIHLFGGQKNLQHP